MTPALCEPRVSIPLRSDFNAWNKQYRNTMYGNVSIPLRSDFNWVKLPADHDKIISFNPSKVWF